MSAGQHAAMKRWVDSFATDVEIVQRYVGDPKAPKAARRLAAAALNYLVTRLDLIPDWEPTCGIVDDAMALRVALAAAAEKDLGDVEAALLAGVGRLANEADEVEDFLGPQLFPRFRRHVEALADRPVRGRTADAIVADEEARTRLYAEIRDEIQRLPPAFGSNPDAIARTVRSYVSAKLEKGA